MSKNSQKEQTFRIKNQMDTNTDEMTNTQTDTRIKIIKQKLLKEA